MINLIKCFYFKSGMAPSEFIKSSKTSKSMALVMVLIFATILLILASGFSKNFRETTKRSESFIDTARATFAAKAAEQLALLKFKSATSDFYFAKKYSDRAGGATPANSPNSWFMVPVDNFNLPLFEFMDDIQGSFRTVAAGGDQVNKGTIPGQASDYNVTYSVFSMYLASSRDYDQDGLVIRTNVNYSRSDGRSINRNFETIVKLSRLP